MAIYLMRREDGSGLVKIGHSCSPQTRLKVMQQESRCDVTLLWQSHPDHGAKTEKQLHRVLDYWRRSGEWFYFGNADPVAIVCAAMHLVEQLPSRGAAVDGELTIQEMVMLPDGLAVGERHEPIFKSERLDGE